MRVTCPKCSTEYEIDISVLPETGRVVKCWKCAHDWLQTRPPSNFEERTETKTETSAKTSVKDNPDQTSRPAKSPASTSAANDVKSPPPASRSLDPNLARVLQEEAARERLARQAKTKPADTPPSPPSNDPDPAPAKSTAAPVSELAWPIQKVRKPSPQPANTQPETKAEPGDETPPDAVPTVATSTVATPNQTTAKTEKPASPAALSESATQSAKRFTLSRNKKATQSEPSIKSGLDDTDAVNFDDDFLLDWDFEENEPVIPPGENKNVTKQDFQSAKPLSGEPKIHKVPVRIEVDKPEEDPTEDVPKRPSRRAFRGGFMVAVLAFVLAALAYLFAPEITIRFPQTQPELGYYVTKVDEMRDRLSTIIIPAEGNQDADKN